MRLNHYQRPANPGPGVKYSQCERGILWARFSPGQGGNITRRVNGEVLNLLSGNMSLRVNEDIWKPVAKQETSAEEWGEGGSSPLAELEPGGVCIHRRIWCASPPLSSSPLDSPSAIAKRAALARWRWTEWRPKRSVEGAFGSNNRTRGAARSLSCARRASNCGDSFPTSEVAIPHILSWRCACVRFNCEDEELVCREREREIEWEWGDREDERLPGRCWIWKWNRRCFLMWSFASSFAVSREWNTQNMRGRRSMWGK